MADRLSNEETALFYALRNLIFDADYSGLYTALLYQGGSILVNKRLFPNNESLLEYAILADNPVAFDILFLFGYQFNINDCKKIVSKLNQSNITIGAKICDRLQDLIDSRYIPPSFDEIFPKKLKLPSDSDVTTQSVIRYKNLELELDTHASDYISLKIALQTIFSDPSVGSLIREAFHGEDFKVILAEPHDLFSYGDCNAYNKRIRIRKDIGIFQIISTLIFELCNGANDKLIYISPDDYNNADDYARAIEEAEYLTYRRHIDILSLLIQKPTLLRRLESIGCSTQEMQNELDGACKNFDEYWAHVNQLHGAEFSHVESYRRYYRQLRQIADYFTESEMGVKKVPIVPAFELIDAKLKSETTAQFELADIFVSIKARVLLAEISHNSEAFAILKCYKKDIAMELASKATHNILSGYKKLTPTEQINFMLQFAQRRKQTIEKPSAIKKQSTGLAA